jgi:hypothetical protein
MQDFEKLGVFYLGRTYDLPHGQARDELVLYDSKDLVTHAVCVGMTGSGKTGLCLSVLEEAAIDGIPALVIDPKGDLGNLLLTFASLRGEEFEPWINEEEARRRGVAPREFAAQQAELWKKGLADWGQDGARIQRLRDAAELVIYTPGSNAGLPVSIVRSFAAPGQALLDDTELFRERVSTTASSLLALLGIQADPIQSREHILIANILAQAWRAGRDLDLAALIAQIQSPPVQRIGVLDLESFFPAKDRFALAMQINNLLAAPGFEAWLQGEPLDIDALLHTPQGKPRVAIFSIAHLSDAERMFFVSLLLNQTLGWMRSQPGTTSLRALVYMDEIFGYFPPTSNPPSKLPLLTLLKQARAFGLGVMLATQNPVDLDYKGLANCGTWFIGRLQTERDKARVIEGLEGAAASAAANFERGAMEQTLAALGNRIFLMNNVHDDAPIVFQVRWALSYLRGPLTRQQIKLLMSSQRAAGASAAASVAAPAAVAASPLSATPAVTAASPAAVVGQASSLPGAAAPAAVAVATTAPTPSAAASVAAASAGGADVSAAPAAPLLAAAPRPVLPPEIPQFFVPIRSGQPTGSRLLYRPALFGCAKVYYSDSKAGIDSEQDTACLAEFASGAVSVNWPDAAAVELSDADLEREPADAASFSTLPPEAAKAKSYDAWQKSLADALYRTAKLEIFKSPSTKQVSKPGESERDFRVRLQQVAREQRDLLVEKLRQKYAPKLAVLADRIRRAEQAVQREAEQAKQAKLQTAISFGATLLGAFMGRKVASAANVGKATTAVRGVSRSMKESSDVARAGENVAALRQQQADLEAQFQSETATLESKVDPLTEPLETVVIKPKKTNITVRLVALVWTPHWQSADGLARAAWE